MRAGCRNNVIEYEPLTLSHVSCGCKEFRSERRREWPNRDVSSVNDSVNGNWTYTYDDFNRIATADVTGESYTYAYDRYGNRWQQELNGSCTARTAVCLTFDANNHINNGVETYDAAGNMLTDGFHNYAYDARSPTLTNRAMGHPQNHLGDVPTMVRLAQCLRINWREEHGPPDL